MEFQILYSYSRKNSEKDDDTYWKDGEIVIRQEVKEDHQNGCFTCIEDGYLRNEILLTEKKFKTLEEARAFLLPYKKDYICSPPIPYYLNTAIENYFDHPLKNIYLLDQIASPQRVFFERSNIKL